MRSLLAWTVRICVISFVLLVSLLHYLNPSLNPLSVTMSEYALGDYGTLMIWAFLFLGASLLCLASGLLGASEARKEAFAPFLALVSVGVSVLLAGFFVVDPAGVAPSPSGFIHDVASMFGFAMAIIAMALWTRRMKSSPGWERYALASARLTFLAAVLFLLFLFSGPAAGLMQRVFIASILAWQLHATRVVLSF